MTKNKRKVIALVMTMAMVMASMFAMTTSVFAGTDKVNVQVQLYGDTYIDENVSAAEIQQNLGGANHLYNAAEDQTTDLNAGDALIQAWYNAYGSDSYDADQILYGWDSMSKVNGLYFITYDGLSSDAGNYYFVGTSIENGKTVYEYYWQGDSWSLYVDGAPADLYASSYKLKDVSSVVFDYNTVTSENFKTETPIPGALSAN